MMHGSHPKITHGAKEAATKPAPMLVGTHPSPSQVTSPTTSGSATISLPALTQPAQTTHCQHEFLTLCVQPTAPVASPIFGFAHFLSGLAILMIFFTLSDPLYKFRIRVASLPLYTITFWILGFISFGTLGTDVWFSNHWPMLETLNNQTYFQAFLAALFIAPTIAWVYVAFISPPVFSKLNYKRYANALYWATMRGNEKELKEIAYELGRSAPNLIKHASAKQTKDKAKKPSVNDYASDVLLLIANKKLCRYIVSDAAITAVEFFESASRDKKYNVPLDTFAANIVTEAIANHDSPLYHEDNGYSSGLLGYTKPFSKALFSDYTLVESLGQNGKSPLDVDYLSVRAWTSKEFKTYCDVVLITLEDFIAKKSWKTHSYSLYRAFDIINGATSDLYKLNNMTDSEAYQSDLLNKLHVSVNFVRNAWRILHKSKKIPKRVPLKTSRRQTYVSPTILDNLAALMFKIIFDASSITKSEEVSWSAQYSGAWSDLIHLWENDDHVAKICNLKLQRLLYDEITEENLFNFKSARILGTSLYTLGLEPSKSKPHDAYDGFHKLILAWTKKNYLKIQEEYPAVAESVLMGRLTYDPKKKQLVKSFAKALGKESEKQVLQLDDLPKKSTKQKPSVKATKREK